MGNRSLQPQKHQDEFAAKHSIAQHVREINLQQLDKNTAFHSMIVVQLKGPLNLSDKTHFMHIVQKTYSYIVITFVMLKLREVVSFVRNFDTLDRN